jgi:transcriptional regulator with XRE-family HTH domain
MQKEMTLPERMVYFRAIHNITQEDFGKLCGLAGVTICNIENGSNPSKRARIRIEMVLKAGETNGVVNQQDKNIQVMQENVPTEICGNVTADTDSGSVGDGQ